MKRQRDDTKPADATAALADWHRSLMTRRTFLVGLAGGSLAALFGGAIAADNDAEMDEARRWLVLDAVQRHLLPSEPDSPGAAEINALAYLRFVVADPKVDAQERRFIVDGVGWLEGISGEAAGRSFLELDAEERERVLGRIAASPAGENWLSTLVLYLMEALLTDPAYGGNPDGIGWRWLRHTPGYPRPTPDKIYPRLLA